MEQPSRLTLTVEEAVDVLGISRSLGYELARQGKIPILRLGRRIVVPTAQLTEFIEGDQPRRPA